LSSFRSVRKMAVSLPRRILMAFVKSGDGRNDQDRQSSFLTKETDNGMRLTSRVLDVHHRHLCQRPAPIRNQPPIPRTSLFSPPAATPPIHAAVSTPPSLAFSHPPLLDHRHQHQIVQHKQPHRALELVRRRVELDERGRLGNDMSTRYEGDELLGAGDGVVEGEELVSVEVLEVEDGGAAVGRGLGERG
jgi:hypothetical protein